MSHHTLRECLRETIDVFDPGGEPLTTPEIAEELDLGRRSTYDRLSRLVERDLIETKKVGANARVWWLPSSTPESTREAPDADDDPPGRAPTRWRQQFDSLVAAVGEYTIALLDRNGRIRTWNAGAERISGYAEDDVVGEHVSILYSEDDRDTGVPEAELAAAEAEGSIEAEGWRVRADGSRFWADVTVTAIRDEDGDLEGYANVVRDVTDRLKRERQLRRERDLTDRVLETAPVGLAIYEADGSLARINSRARRDLGVDAPDVSTKYVYERRLYDADGDPIDREEYPFRRVIETEEPVSDLVLQYDGADGDRRWVTITASPLFDDGGDLERVVVAGRDVTELKRTQRELESQRDEIENELLTAYERGEEAFFAVDEDWQLVHANERAAALFGRSADDVPGRDLWETFSDVAGTEFRERCERALETQESVTFEEYVPPLESWLEVATYPDKSGLSVYLRDVTDRKERERELEESRRRLRTVVDNFPNGAITLVDEELRYVTVGGTIVNSDAAPSESLEGRHIPDVLSPEAADVIVPLYEGALAGETRSFERTIDGRTYQLQSLPIRDDDGEVFAALGMSQDVTEERERQRELERRVRQQETVADLSQYALEHTDVDALLSDAAERTAETLDHDFCEILDLDAETDSLHLRQGAGWDEDIVGRATVSAVEADSQAAYALQSAEPTVVSDLENDPRFEGSDLLTDHDVRSGISTIIGCPDDPWGVLATRDTATETFTDHDVNFVQSVAAILATAIARREDERTLRRQREQLAALNNLNVVVQEITDAVLNQSTREEIERTVCERLADSDSYLFAWIGEADVTARTVNLCAEAGAEGYFDEVDVSLDADDSRSDGPTGRAFRTGEMQICRDVDDDPRNEPWRDHYREYGVRSSAAIPIVHEETVYGVLNLYADRQDAFEGQERVVIEQLGEVVGSAIAASEQKRALMSDEIVELEFCVPDVFETLDVTDGARGPISFEHIVPVGNEEHLAYGSVAPDAVNGLRALVEAMPHGNGLAVREAEDGTKFEMGLSEPPVLSAVASLGGSVESATIVDGDYCMRFHLSPGADVRRLIDTVRETYPTAQLLKRHQTSRDTEVRSNRSGPSVIADLTERQRTTLEVAFHAGFFEWPRSATGQDVAERIGISPPTFHQHLRKAQRKVLGNVLPTSAVRSAETAAE